MSEASIAFSVAIAAVSSVAAILALAVRASVASQRELYEKQSDQLMLFHRAGQSMAEHEIRLAELATREREAEAKAAEARAMEARAQREMSQIAERNGRFPGHSRTISEVE